jgi:hypothetical protein
MNTYFYRQGIEAFKEMHYKGFWGRVWSTLTGQRISLPTLEDTVRNPPHRKFLGLQTVPLKNIVGSLGRWQDFGPGFQPLQKSLQNRWGLRFMLAREDRWEPVRLVKVGSQYFVEDGNHRVSVAHYLGRGFVDAEAWEHPVSPTFTLPGRCAHCGQWIVERA